MTQQRSWGLSNWPSDSSTVPFTQLPSQWLSNCPGGSATGPATQLLSQWLSNCPSDSALSRTSISLTQCSAFAQRCPSYFLQFLKICDHILTSKKGGEMLLYCVNGWKRKILWQWTFKLVFELYSPHRILLKSRKQDKSKWIFFLLVPCNVTSPPLFTSYTFFPLDRKCKMEMQCKTLPRELIRVVTAAAASGYINSCIGIH